MHSRYVLSFLFLKSRRLVLTYILIFLKNQVMDKFGCGSVSVAELRHLLRCNREKYELTVEQIDDIIKLFGSVQNGQIESRKLLQAMLN